MLFAHLTGDHVAIAVDHVAGVGITAIARERKMDRHAVRKVIDHVDATCDRLGLPRPRRAPAPKARHVRQISPRLLRSL